MLPANSNRSAASGARPLPVGPARVAASLHEFFALPVRVQARAWRDLRQHVEDERNAPLPVPTNTTDGAMNAAREKRNP
jgi:hypothetical protein